MDKRKKVIKPRTLEQRFGHDSWCKCGGFCNPMEPEEETLCCRDNSEIPERRISMLIFCVCACV